MMDIRETVKLAWDRKQSLHNLRVDMHDRLVLHMFDGTWKVDRELIAFLQAFQDCDQIVMEDVYEVPRTVNPQELLKRAKEEYQFVTNAWAVKYKEIARKRKVDV